MGSKTVMTAAEIELAVQRIGLQIMERHHNQQNLAVVGIHTCGVPLAARLHAFIEEHSGKKISFGSLDINLYRDDWSLVSQNPLVKMTDLGFDVDDARIVLVDDVLFTGRTIRAALDAIIDYGRPAGIELAVLVDRGGRELPIQPDYCGLEVAVAKGERVNVVIATAADGSDRGGEVLIEG